MLEFQFPTYGVYDADLGYVNSQLHAFRCREQFHDSFIQYSGSGEMVFKVTLKRAASLIGKIERHLSVPANKRAVFGPTNQVRWIAIKPQWWVEDKMRFSLFTLLLRASRTHLNIKDLVRSGHLRGSTKALKVFLSGKTNFIGSKVTGYYGWKNHMARGMGGVDCLLTDNEVANLEKAKKNAKLNKMANKLSRLGGCPEAILHQLSKVVV